MIIYLFLLFLTAQSYSCEQPVSLRSLYRDHPGFFDSGISELIVRNDTSHPAQVELKNAYGDNFASCTIPAGKCEIIKTKISNRELKDELDTFDIENRTYYRLILYVTSQATRLPGLHFQRAHVLSSYHTTKPSRVNLSYLLSALCQKK